MSATQELGPNQKAWIAALRSGEFIQGDGVLEKRTKDGTFNCCLGVLCRVAKIRGRSNVYGDVVFTGCETMYAPPKAQKFVGLRDEVGAINGRASIYGRYRSLAKANDSGVAFDKIADFCEAHPEAVFTEPR